MSVSIAHRRHIENTKSLLEHSMRELVSIIDSSEPDYLRMSVVFSNIEEQGRVGSNNAFALKFHVNADGIHQHCGRCEKSFGGDGHWWNGKLYCNACNEQEIENLHEPAN